MATAEDRERKTQSVAVSMGDLLLKGYKMLATSCELCNNVLLQDRQGIILCVSCNDVRDENGGVIDKIDDDSNHGNESGATSGARVSISLSATEDFLLTEIKKSTQYLQNIREGTDLHHKQTYIHHIRDCAETIKALRNISD